MSGTDHVSFVSGTDHIEGFVSGTDHVEAYIKNISP